MKSKRHNIGLLSPIPGSGDPSSISSPTTPNEAQDTDTNSPIYDWVNEKTSTASTTIGLRHLIARRADEKVCITVSEGPIHELYLAKVVTLRALSAMETQMRKPLTPKGKGHNTGDFSQLDKDDLKRQIDQWSEEAKQADRLLVGMIHVACSEARSGNWKFFGVYKGNSADSFEIVHLKAQEAGWNSYVSPGHVNTITWPPFEKG